MNQTSPTNESAPTIGNGSVTTGPIADLADPDDRPGADVVVFDGQCQFCQKQVKRLDWFDGGNRLSFVSLHDPRVAQRYPQVSHEQLMDQMYVMTQSGAEYGGAAAVRYLSRRLPRLWWLAPLLHIPFTMPVWQWLYRQVAVRRYRWNRKQAGGDECEDACEIHLGK